MFKKRVIRISLAAALCVAVFGALAAPAKTGQKQGRQPAKAASQANRNSVLPANTRR
ncbi:hypothetical protein [Cupriavidus lacunae]|uniref:hypothetical protein n=1 Tax=Cupriavidus lacunae TaxID=2666307 RepID=UPI001374CE1D|nr:hypothetical protein [Cupriavidus lacunae]